MPKIIVITGPTATGKTTLGVLLAKQLGGEVISADSMQIYRDLNIGTAKPTEEEMRGVPHHMIDIVPPTENILSPGTCRKRPPASRTSCRAASIRSSWVGQGCTSTPCFRDGRLPPTARALCAASFRSGTNKRAARLFWLRSKPLTGERPKTSCERQKAHRQSAGDLSVHRKNHYGAQRRDTADSAEIPGLQNRADFRSAGRLVRQDQQPCGRHDFRRPCR